MAKELNEAQRVGLLRNALLVAGYEMGQTGDHWPVINDTIHKIGEDWEEYNLKKDAKKEMRIQIYQQLDLLAQEVANEPDPKLRLEMKKKLSEMHDLFGAYFSPLDRRTVAPLSEEEIPPYIKRAETIVATLGGHHD